MKTLYKVTKKHYGNIYIYVYIWAYTQFQINIQQNKANISICALYILKIQQRAENYNILWPYLYYYLGHYTVVNITTITIYT